MRTRVVTWNIQGGRRPDLGAVADFLAASAADIVALQEVQRHQAERLRHLLGMESAWRLKHHPLVRPAEGHAVLSRWPLRDVGTLVLARRWSWWSWRRRITLSGVVSTPGGDVRVLCTHLGAGVPESERTHQAERLLQHADADVATVVAGDLNAGPDSPTLAAFADHGFEDPWIVTERDRAPTNWAGARHRPPTQHLDYVLVRGLRPVEVAAPVHGDDDLERFAALSDHLPVVAEVEAPPTMSGSGT